MLWQSLVSSVRAARFSQMVLQLLFIPEKMNPVLSVFIPALNRAITREEIDAIMEGGGEYD